MSPREDCLGIGTWPVTGLGGWSWLAGAGAAQGSRAQAQLGASLQMGRPLPGSWVPGSGAVSVRNISPKFAALTISFWTDSLGVPKAPPLSQPILVAFVTSYPDCLHLYPCSRGICLAIQLCQLVSFWVWSNASWWGCLGSREAEQTGEGSH